ncbi:multicatalytic endopeptidase [Elasticomyces elasticus]|uniref:Multicatalytic endopeptidase n=1 Tax=Elasticomyces elasticus TaxID=574655 RepID=A0AAN7VKX2_9PEZI|nr:multicatalytic endopeptidase [Elasticomyces elasticus]
MGNIPAPPLLDGPLSHDEMQAAFDEIQAAITASFARLQEARDRSLPDFNNNPLVLHGQRMDPDPANPPQPTQAELDELQSRITAASNRLQEAIRDQANNPSRHSFDQYSFWEDRSANVPLEPDSSTGPIDGTQDALNDLQSRITAASNRLQEAIRDPAFNRHRLDMTSLPDVPFDPPPTLPGRRNAVLHDGDPPHGRNRRNTDPYPGPHRRRRVVPTPVLNRPPVFRPRVHHILNRKTTDTNIIDNAETVYISSLALLKMLRHGRAGVPMEVMGLMLGEFVDDYTVRVVDVFAMPQSGTGVSVEAVDPVFQTKMMDMLRQTGRPETVVGWYHSHPGFGCWLSSVDINTQQSFEQLTPRAVAVVIDPIQSVKGKVVIDAFRLINPQTLMLGQEPRQTTSNLGHLNKPSIQALIHGLNRHYYSIGIGYRKTALEEGMLMNLHKSVWTEALTMPDFKVGSADNLADLTKLVSLAEGYEKRVVEEGELTKEELRTRYVGKVDPKKHLQDVGERVMEGNLVGVLRGLIGKEAGLPALSYGGKGVEGAGVNGNEANGGGVGGEGMEVDEEL